MRRLTHLLLAPSSRLVRLVLSEKRLSYDLYAAEEPQAHLPVLVEPDGARREGLWAIIDHLEGAYLENSLTPEDSEERATTLRWLDWAMGPFHEHVTQKIVFENTAQRFTGATSLCASDMNVIHSGRQALQRPIVASGNAFKPKAHVA